MNTSFLLIGGNEGEPRLQLAKAVEAIAGASCRILRRSSLYQTAAWGKTDQPDFLNQALEVATNLEAPALLEQLLTIEERMGRRRMEKYGSRLIDIDILFFNEAVIDLPALVVPHPEIQNRRFVLAPLAEIAPDYLHPLLGKTVRELLAACPDPLEVRRLEGGDSGNEDELKKSSVH